MVRELRCPFRVDWELDAVSGCSGCSSTHYGQLPLSSSMGICRAAAATDCVRAPSAPEEVNQGRGERARQSGMGGGFGILMLK